MTLKSARLNWLVVCVLLAAFLFVQADFPISQAAAVRLPLSSDACAVHQCCCSREMHEHATCCCFSKKTPTKTGDLLRVIHCGHNGQSRETVIGVRFEITLPLVPAVPADQSLLTLVIPTGESVNARSVEPPVPPPRFLLPA